MRLANKKTLKNLFIIIIFLFILTAFVTALFTSIILAFVLLGIILIISCIVYLFKDKKTKYRNK